MTEELATLLRSSPLPSVGNGKDSTGDLVIVGGSSSCPGSAILAGTAALRSGAGRVQLVVHPDVAAAVGAAFPEVLVLGWDHEGAPPDAVATRLAQAGAVIVGPGLDDRAPATALTVSPLVDGFLVVDATALPALGAPGFGNGSPVLAAPNPGEARRLMHDDDTGEDDLPDLARRVAKLLDGPAAVRGETSILDDGEGRQWEERSTSPGLGTPGSGDVLMGALGAFLVRGAPPVAALGWAIAAHARAGRLLAAAEPVGFLAREIADTLPAAIGALASG